MLNMIRSDFYRFKHSKSTWILLIVSVAISLFMAFTLGFLMGDANWLAALMSEYDATCQELGMTNPFRVYAEVYAVSCNDVFDFVTQALTRDLALFMAIFVSFFSVAVTSSGYIKNIAFMHSRGTRFFSGALVILVFAAMITGAGALTEFLIALIFFKTVDMSMLVPFLLFLILFAGLLWIVGLLVQGFCSLFRRSNIGLILSILYISLGSSMFYLTADSILQSGTGSNFYVEFVTPLGNMNLLKLGKWDTYLASVVVIVLYFVFTALTEVVFLKNKDLI